VCFTNLDDICNSGQQKKVYNNIAARVRGGDAVNDMEGQDSAAVPLPPSGFVMNSPTITDPKTGKQASASGWPTFSNAMDIGEDEGEPEQGKGKGQRGDPDYKGATVLDPKPNFYDDRFVSSLDFASLYPSIMRAENLCPSTILEDREERAYLRGLSRGPKPTAVFLESKSTSTEDLEVALKMYRHVVVSYRITHIVPKGGESEIPPDVKVYEEAVAEGSEPIFGKKRGKAKGKAQRRKMFDKDYYFYHSVQGVMPRMLAHVLTARKRVKKMMKLADNPFDRAIYNGRQLALKVSANSVYGFTGCGSTGMYACKPIAAVVTLTGRKMIDITKEAAERLFAHEGAEVVYGDTDSVMVAWRKGLTLEEAWELGEQAAAAITGLFKAPNELENEALKANFLLFDKKKTYAAYEYEPGKDGKLHGHVLIKGLDPVRRDKTEVLRRVSKKVLHALLQEGSSERAFEAIVDTLSSIVENALPMKDYSMTKSTKPVYSSDVVERRMPQIQARNRMIARGEEVPPIGARVQFVFVQRPGSLADKSESLEYAERAKLKLERRYYVSNLLKPLTKVLKYTWIDAKTLCEHAVKMLSHKETGDWEGSPSRRCKTLTGDATGEETGARMELARFKSRL